MAATGFCPSCGTSRVGSFRYCRSCGLDFDAQPPPAAAPSPAAAIAAPVPIAQPAEPRKSQTLRGVLIATLLGIVAIAFLANVLSGHAPDGSGSADPDLPPVGSIWFGTSFDTTTFAIPARITTAAVGQPFALVAHLPRSLKSGDGNLRISLDGTTYVNQALNVSGEGELFGVTYTPPVAGSYEFDITDLGGNVLASGTVPAS